MKRSPTMLAGVAALILFIGASRLYPGFGTPGVFVSLFTDQAVMGIAALGLTFVILTGGIDLSVGAMAGCSGIMLASLLKKLPAAGAIPLILIFGVLFGLGQGALIARLKLPPFLVTLGGLFFCRGLALAISQESISVTDPLVKQLTNWAWRLPGLVTITLPSILFVLTALVLIWLARQTRMGRTVYAVGGDASAAAQLGLPVELTLMRAYALSGFLASMAGVLFVIYTGSGNPLASTGMELDAISAVVIGGTLLTGGVGAPLGTLLGVLTIGIIQSAIIFDGRLSSWWSKIAVGVLLLAFLLLQSGLHLKPKRLHASQ